MGGKATPKKIQITSPAHAHLSEAVVTLFNAVQKRDLSFDRGFCASDLKKGVFPPEVRLAIQKLGWNQFALHPTEKIVYSLVYEWHCALHATRETQPPAVSIRGCTVPVAMEEIRQFYHLPTIAHCHFEGYRSRASPEFLKKVLEKIAIPEAKWNISSQGNYTVKRNDLTLGAKLIYTLVRTRILPTSYIDYVNRERAILLWCILSHKPVDVAALIYREIWANANTSSGKLCFPSLITSLCLNAGVDVHLSEPCTEVGAMITAEVKDRFLRPRRKPEAVVPAPRAIDSAPPMSPPPPSQYERGEPSGSRPPSASTGRIDSGSNSQLDQILDLLRGVVAAIGHNAAEDIRGSVFPTPGLADFSNRLQKQTTTLEQLKVAFVTLGLCFNSLVQYIQERDQVVNANFTQQFSRFKPLPPFPTFPVFPPEHWRKADDAPHVPKPSAPTSPSSVTPACNPIQHPATSDVIPTTKKRKLRPSTMQPTLSTKGKASSAKTPHSSTPRRKSARLSQQFSKAVSNTVEDAILVDDDSVNPAPSRHKTGATSVGSSPKRMKDIAVVPAPAPEDISPQSSSSHSASIRAYYSSDEWQPAQ